MLFRWIIPLLLLSLLALPAGSVNRTALVVGNGAYDHSPLRNPPSDARAVAAKLRGLGFEVIEEIDADRRDFRRAVRRFADRLRERGGAGLFLVRPTALGARGLPQLEHAGLPRHQPGISPGQDLTLYS